MKIKAIILDVDGTLTDARKYYFESGGEVKIAKSFSVRDGKGIDMAQKTGILFSIITSDKWEPIFERAKHLNIKEVFYDEHNKASCIEKICQKYQIDLSEVCFIGDDINDISAMEIVGLPCCVGDSVEKVKNVCLDKNGIIAKNFGGNGAVREIIEKIIKINEQ